MRVNVLEKREKPIQVERVVKPAYFKNVDTGEVSEKVVWREGNREVERAPIYNRVSVPPIKEIVTEHYEVWEVETTDKNGLSEVHEFRSKEARDLFLKGLR